MRLAKKAAAVILAAAMTVSMLTACSGGGGGSTSGNNPGNTPSGGNSSTVTPGGGGSGNTPGGGGSGSGTTPTPDAPDTPGSSDDGKDDSGTVSYLNSRTGKFYKTLGTAYTADMQVKINENGLIQTAPLLFATDGNRVYGKTVADIEGQTIDMITMIDEQGKTLWEVIPMSHEIMTAMGHPDKNGIYFVEEFDGDSNQIGDPIGETAPVEGVEFNVEKQGTFYIESQTAEGVQIAYWYEGNSFTPKYIIIYQSNEKGQMVEAVNIEFKTVTPGKNEKLLNFEEILKAYYDATDDPEFNEGIGDVETFKMPSTSLKRAGKRSAKRAIVW